MNPAGLTSNSRKYQREVGKSQLGILFALYSVFIVSPTLIKTFHVPSKTQIRRPFGYLKITPGFVSPSLRPSSPTHSHREGISCLSQSNKRSDLRQLQKG